MKEINWNIVFKYFLRVLLSPLIFIWGIFVLCAATFFPLPIIVIVSGVGIITIPLVWIFNKVGSNLKNIVPFMSKYDDFEKGKNIFRDHFFGLTIYFWGAFAIMFYFIKTGKIWVGD